MRTLAIVLLAAGAFAQSQPKPATVTPLSQKCVDLQAIAYRATKALAALPPEQQTGAPLKTAQDAVAAQAECQRQFLAQPPPCVPTATTPCPPK